MKPFFFLVAGTRSILRVAAFTRGLSLIAGLGAMMPVHAASQQIDGVNITTVSVNGGADTANPGTSCIRVSQAISAACPAGFLAIPNNNRQLLAAALLNKATGSQVWLYYEDAAEIRHCPGQVFTPCSVISIESK